MLIKLSDKVWYGNWEAPFECAKEVGSVINVAHHFRASRGRDKYWDNLKHIPHTVPLFRLSLRDKDTFTDQYARSMMQILDVINQMGAFPLLAHCQMGGHRGPSAAVFAEWYWSGRNPGMIDALFSSVFPKFVHGQGGNYRRTMYEYCKMQETMAR